MHSTTSCYGDCNNLVMTLILSPDERATRRSGRRLRLVRWRVYLCAGRASTVEVTWPRALPRCCHLTPVCAHYLISTCMFHGGSVCVCVCVFVCLCGCISCPKIKTIAQYTFKENVMQIMLRQKNIY